MSSGATTSASSVSVSDVASIAAMVTITVVALSSDRVTSSVMTCLVCCVSFITRARICPVLTRENQPSGSRCRCA